MIRVVFLFLSMPEWNLDTMRVSNSPGVVTRIPRFGDANTVVHLDPYGLVPFMKPVVDALVSKGYKRGLSI